MSKTLALIFLAHMLVVGMCGVAVRLYIASFLLARESTESSRFSTRFVYRYFLFWTNYMVSFFVTPALIIKPIFGNFDALAATQEMRGVTIAIMCLPLAVILSLLERRILIWGENRKIRGIDAFNKKYGPKRRA